MVVDCAFCGALLGATPDRCPACRRGQPVDSDGYQGGRPPYTGPALSWLAPATLVPLLVFAAGLLAWSFGFLRSFGKFAAVDDVALVTRAYEVGSVLMITALFIVGIKAVRRLENARDAST